MIIKDTEGKRSHGRSPTRWSDQVIRDELDRNRWKQIIRSRCNPAADHDPQGLGNDQREREREISVKMY